MKRYQPAVPRAVLMAAATALTAITLGVAVVAPADVAGAASNANDASTKSVIGALADAPTLVVRIDVVAIREPTVASVQVRGATPKRKPQET